jgi:hypothetical protein
MTEHKARCMKCKIEVTPKEQITVEVKGKGGSTRKAMKGKCPTCGTVCFRFLPKAG